ncbi:MAG TPA: hypothetical protein VJX29_02475 [Candidatus Acidoferrales bacterium]|nr:hypothetical protein [Candidatus Acidoferrales bacterium]
MKNIQIAKGFAIGLPLALLALFSGGAAVAQAPAQKGVPVRITVTATSRGKGQEPPRLAKEDFLVYQGHERRPVLSAVSQQGADNKLDLYVVVDDGTESTVSLNYKDISSFVRELPSTARVAVLYARNGTVVPGHDLTDDREAAVKALRIPLGRIEAGGGIYLSLADMAKHLPPAPDRRRAILFLSSGIDLFRGFADTYPGTNPDLQEAIDRLNRSEITVYPIYVSPAAHFSQNLFLVNNGQACLSLLADETGGEAYFQGFQTPISMQPFLEEMGRHLDHQYLVTFAAKPAKKSRYESIRVTTEVSGVDVTGPGEVYVPAQKP